MIRSPFILLSVTTLLIASGCSTARQPPVEMQAAAPAEPAAPQPPALVPAKAPAAKSDFDTLQGTWKGHEIGENEDGTATLIISGMNLEFHGANPNDWYKGTFVLKEDANPKQCVFSVTDCAAPDYIGKKAIAIYALKDGTLTIAGNEPGNLEAPSTFDVPGARRFVFKEH